MKIAYANDIHLEFGDIHLENKEQADVLILSGDILVAHYLDFFQEIEYNQGFPDENIILSNRFHNFFRNVTKEFPRVIYVAGNHEHYNGNFHKTHEELYTYLDYNGLSILNNNSVVIGDVTFFGGTMWTNMNNDDPFTKWSIRSMMNDFRCIKTGEKVTLTPEDCIEEFYKFQETLKDTYDKTQGKMIVVSHHSPSFKTIDPMFNTPSNKEINGGYMSDLDEFIMDHPRIKYWFCGHQHHRFEIPLGETIIANNSRGYHKHQKMADSFELKYLEV
jgi:Icc-related predicted phosphoesterase